MFFQVAVDRDVDRTDFVVCWLPSFVVYVGWTVSVRSLSIPCRGPQIRVFACDCCVGTSVSVNLI